MSDHGHQKKSPHDQLALQQCKLCHNKGAGHVLWKKDEARDPSAETAKAPLKTLNDTGLEAEGFQKVGFVHHRSPDDCYDKLMNRSEESGSQAVFTIRKSEALAVLVNRKHRDQRISREADKLLGNPMLSKEDGAKLKAAMASGGADAPQSAKDLSDEMADLEETQDTAPTEEPARKGWFR